MKQNKTYTKGNVIVEDIKVGDIHYEYEFGVGIKCRVITLPEFNEEDGVWEWQSENLKTYEVINYGVHPEYPHYGPNLYDYEAYVVNHHI